MTTGRPTDTPQIPKTEQEIENEKKEDERRKIEKDQVEHAQRLDYATSLRTLAAKKQAAGEALTEQDVRVRYRRVPGPGHKPQPAAGGFTSQPAVPMTEMFAEGLWQADEATVPPGSGPRYLMNISKDGTVSTIVHPTNIWEKVYASKKWWGMGFDGVHGQQQEMVSQQIDFHKDHGTRRIKLDFVQIDPDPHKHVPIHELIDKKMLDQAIKTADEKGMALVYGDNINKFIEYLEKHERSKLPVSDPANKTKQFSTWTEYYENERLKLEDKYYKDANKLASASANLAFKRHADLLKGETKVMDGFGQPTDTKATKRQAYSDKLLKTPKEDGSVPTETDQLDRIEKEIANITTRMNKLERARYDLDKNLQASEELIKGGKVREAHTGRKLGKKNRRELFEELKAERKDLQQMEKALSKAVSDIRVNHPPAAPGAPALPAKEQALQAKIEKQEQSLLTGRPPKPPSDPGVRALKDRLNDAKLDDAIKKNNKIVKKLDKAIPRKSGPGRSGPGS